MTARQFMNSYSSAGHLDLNQAIPASIMGFTEDVPEYWPPSAPFTQTQFDDADIPAEWRTPQKVELTREESDAVELDRR